MGRTHYYVLWLQATLLCVAKLVLADQGSLPQALNIDCGWSSSSNTSYNDPSTGLEWVGDEDFITTGFNVGPYNVSEDYLQLGQSRIFNDPRQSKFCYDIPVQSNTTYLIRAAFEASRLQNTVFNVTINSTFWATAQPFIDGGYLAKDTTQTVLEALFRSQGNVVFVCLLPQIGVPFISALQLRPLADDMYVDAKSGPVLMKTVARLNVGVNWTTEPFVSKVIRFPQDSFDRIWAPENFLFGASTAYNVSQVIYPPDVPHQVPPLQVMMDAETDIRSLDAFTIPTRSPQQTQEYYGVLYFQQPPESTQSLALDVVSNLTTVQYNGYVNVSSSEITIVEFRGPFAGDFSVYIFVDKQSRSGTIVLNALELYSEHSLNTSSTHADDVEALQAVRNSFRLENWTGDPCFPTAWEWLTCTSDLPARVTHVKLSGMNITGPIPSNITGLTELVELWLDDNNLTGSIPALPAKNINIVHLESNSLSGRIPDGLALSQTLTELYVENNDLSGPLPAGLLRNGLTFRCDADLFPQKGHKAELVAYVGPGIAVFLGLVVLFWCCYTEGRKATDGGKKGGLQLNLSHRDDARHAISFSLKALKAATNNFSQKIGQGSFGPVYYGKLCNGQEVAVKVNDAKSSQGAVEFVNEVVLLSRVHCKHLVSLVGYCQSSNQQMLVYEYMPNGNLRDRLYGNSGATLEMSTRLRIALGAAKGLDYMHNDCNPKIVHRDVKSSNILLNDQLLAKVADFGLSKSSIDETSGFSTKVKGTPGYLDPAYFRSHRLTEKSDVYSFGTVLLEIITAKHPLTRMLPDSAEGNLRAWVQGAFQAGNIHLAIDPALEQRYNRKAVETVVELALSSTESKPGNRPDMAQVVEGLIAALKLESPSELATSEKPGKNNPVMTSQEFQELRAAIERIAPAED